MNSQTLFYFFVNSSKATAANTVTPHKDLCPHNVPLPSATTVNTWRALSLPPFLRVWESPPSPSSWDFWRLEDVGSRWECRLIRAIRALGHGEWRSSGLLMPWTCADENKGLCFAKTKPVMSGLDGNVRSPRAKSKEKSISHSLLSNIMNKSGVFAPFCTYYYPLSHSVNPPPPQFSYRKYKQKHVYGQVEELQKINDDWGFFVLSYNDVEQSCKEDQVRKLPLYPNSIHSIVCTPFCRAVQMLKWGSLYLLECAHCNP